jgi:hypothetical protein
MCKFSVISSPFGLNIGKNLKGNVFILPKSFGLRGPIDEDQSIKKWMRILGIFVYHLILFDRVGNFFREKFGSTRI